MEPRRTSISRLQPANSNCDRFRLPLAMADNLVRVLAHAEFELPTVGGFGALAPELKNAELGEVALEADGDEVVFQRVVFGKMGFERVGFGELGVGPGVEQVAGLVGFADGGAEEAEGGGRA